MKVILVGLTPVLKWVIMKKDSELPWVVRLARWAGFAFCVAYGALLVMEKGMEVFQ